MTLDKLLIEKGVGMTLVFTTWNKHQQDSVKSQPHGNSTLTDDLGNEYRLADQVGPNRINGGTKAEHKLIFPLPKANANRLTAKIRSNSVSDIFYYLPPFSINLSKEVQSKLRE